ncbi:hypothetical protein VHEMI07493 [[Torrubiella] hemipterigena]|uniref:Uncharacterized protein n=1 Tax=[Torrubiella] hemipterigena TaxID=1531966 RepID=A0A0A1TN14_9HYPO|nr:hypothetical protein VHEMI07493 [[Torrubiella] hemipterigena]
MEDSKTVETISSDHGDSVGLSQNALKLLSKRFEHVYEVDQVRGIYLKPSTLRGTPTKKLVESSPEWDPSWASLDDYLKNEQKEQQAKTETREQLAYTRLVGKDLNSLLKRHKRHQDNCSKHTKILEIFGPDTTYHPNQLVARQHLPREGLCDQEIMYKLACKVSNMQTLEKFGYLKMDPWDFIRWRVNNLLTHELPHAAARGTTIIKTIVSRLGSHQETNSGFVDPYMRELVLFAARFEQRSNCYGSRRAKAVRDRPTVEALYRFNSLPTKLFRSLPICTSVQKRKTARVIAKQSNAPKRKHLASGTGYTGVNNFRKHQTSTPGI